MSRGDREDDLTDPTPLVTAADAYLTDLSRGERPGDGGDDVLADLFLELREEVEEPMPDAPRLPEEEPAEQAGNVVPLRRKGGFGRGLVGGLVGAAAATLVVVGGGAAIYNAEPGSPLWGVSKQLFGERAAVVEMAGTLDDLDGYVESGDVEGIRALLNDARARLGQENGGQENDGDTDTARGGDNAARGEERRAPATVTTTATVGAESEGEETPAAPAPEPDEPTPAESPAERETVRETETVTVTERETATETEARTETETVTVVPQEPVEPAPTNTAAPTSAPSTAAPSPEQ